MAKGYGQSWSNDLLRVYVLSRRPTGKYSQYVFHNSCFWSVLLGLMATVMLFHHVRVLSIIYYRSPTHGPMNWLVVQTSNFCVSVRDECQIIQVFGAQCLEFFLTKLLYGSDQFRTKICHVKELASQSQIKNFTIDLTKKM